jgi:bisanhydrobacterioruberin hydratase
MVVKFLKHFFSKLTKTQILIGVLVIFHCVGIIGLLSSFRDQILPLSALNLCLSFVVLYFGRIKKQMVFIVFAAGAFIWGMCLELVGVHTHLLFGNYSYGESLGWKFIEVPLIIGVNWAVLCSISQELISSLKLTIFVKTIVGALIMTALDFLIEPVAMKSDFWSWENNQIPFFNYVCWFVGALPLHFMYQKLKLNEQNTVARGLFIILALFFTILNLA